MKFQETEAKIDKIIWQPEEFDQAVVTSLLSSLSPAEFEKLRSFVRVQHGMGEDWSTSRITFERGLEVCRRSQAVLAIIDELIPCEI